MSAPHIIIVSMIFKKLQSGTTVDIDNNKQLNLGIVYQNKHALVL
jgi:hypothetical protein